MFTWKFWRGALERAIKSAAQFTLFAWGLAETPAGDVLQVPDAFSFNWRLGLGSAVAGAILSVLTSISSAPFGDEGTPSLVDQ
jgi:Putative lactococcus lactis phage r1t holin